MCQYLWDSLVFRQGKGKIVLRKWLAPAAHLTRSSCLTPQERCALWAQSQLKSPVEIMPCSLREPVQRLEPQLPAGKAVSPPASPLSDAPLRVEQSWGEPSSSTAHSARPPEKVVIWDPTETSTLLLPPRGPTGLGGTVNLILSIGKKGEKKKVQPVASSEQPGEEALWTVGGGW